MNVRPRLLMVSFASAKTGMSNKTKPPTHYETLEVNPRATQDEIKSAYFKLSKQYHPDRNSSEAATAKFRDVAEAYEVVGNYDSRKTYDRSIRTQTRYQVPHENAKPEDPKIKYYQSKAAVFRHPRTGSTPMYDFDAWTKAHYGLTLDRTLKDKMEAARKREARKEECKPYSPGKDIIFMVFAGALAAGIVLLSIQEPIDSNPALTIRQRNELDKTNESETKSEKYSVNLSSK